MQFLSVLCGQLPSINYIFIRTSVILCGLLFLTLNDVRDYTLIQIYLLNPPMIQKMIDYHFHVRFIDFHLIGEIIDGMSVQFFKRGIVDLRLLFF